MTSIFGSVLADDEHERRRRPSTPQREELHTTAAITSSSALTVAITKLPAEARTVAEFTLTALDLFDDRELTTLVAGIRRLRSRKKTEPTPMPRGLALDRDVADRSQAVELPPFLGYNIKHPDFPGDLVSMVWAREPQLPIEGLPAMVYTAKEITLVIGTTSAWVSNRVAAANRQKATAVLLVSRDGTRAARRSLSDANASWTVIRLPEGLRT